MCSYILSLTSVLDGVGWVGGPQGRSRRMRKRLPPPGSDPRPAQSLYRPRCPGPQHSSDN